MNGHAGNSLSRMSGLQSGGGPDNPHSGWTYTDKQVLEYLRVAENIETAVDWQKIAFTMGQPQEGAGSATCGR
ncbi:MAG: hypothetical protein ACLGJC_31040 [Alphaproteobacteria bacterium]